MAKNNFGYELDYKFIPQEKRTLRQNIEELLQLARDNNRQDLVDFCKDRLFLLDKRNESRRAAADVSADTKIKEKIMETLIKYDYEGGGLTVSEIILFAELDGYSTQKISAMCRQLVEAGRCEKVGAKHNPRFRRYESLESYLQNRKKNENENKFMT